MKLLHGLAIILAVTGCTRSDLYEPTMISQNKPVVQVEESVEKYPSLNLHKNSLDHIAGMYADMTSPKILLTAIYDPETDPHFCDGQKIYDVRWNLKRRGVDINDIAIDRLPVKGAESQLLVSYEDMTLAAAPECAGQSMPGLKQASSNDREYTLGCSMQQAMANQIANPRHALGVAGLGKGGAMSAVRANSIQNAQNGSPDPMPYVPGYQISDSVTTTE